MNRRLNMARPLRLEQSQILQIFRLGGRILQIQRKWHIFQVLEAVEFVVKVDLNLSLRGGVRGQTCVLLVN